MAMARDKWFVLFCFTGIVSIGTTTALLVGQPPSPPPPAKYVVHLRYDINAPRDAHVAQYDALIGHLLSLGFEFIPPLEKHANSDREDPSKNELTGLLASRKVLDIFRDRHVVSALLLPAGYTLPEAADQPVGVRLELAPGLGPTRARELAEQVRPILQVLGFREAVGYDHHGYTGRPFTRMVGTIPAARVHTLLKDLRTQPAGWFGPLLLAEELPTPLRNLSPILVAEVLPSMPPLVEPARPAPRPTLSDNKVADDLWGLVTVKDKSGVHMQIVLANVPDADDTRWRTRLMDVAPNLIIEGRLGQFVTGIAPAVEAANLAALADVSVVRLARPAQVEVDPAIKIAGDNARALRQSGLEALHKRKFLGQGVRLAIVDTDFRGWADLVKSKQLPAKTRLVDLTRTLDARFRPAAYRDDGKVGHGTQCAVAAAFAAPAAELVLIRTDAVAPFRLRQIVAYIQGEFLSPDLMTRRDQLTLARAELRRAWADLMKEEKKLNESFEDYSEFDEEYDFLGAVHGWIFNPRVLHLQRKAYEERKQRELEEHAEVLRKLIEEVISLKGIQIVANPLVWNDGYPLGGMSPLSRSFDEPPLRAPLWFQSGGNTRGRSWVGLFRDVDENGVMEFAPPEAALPRGLWTPELNSIGWQPYQGQKDVQLPAKVKLRVSMQWRESHDPDYYARPGEEDAYRKPLAAMHLVLLRQVDPEGKKVPADRFDVVARSHGLPQRLDYTPAYAIYEQVIEVTLPSAGRYSLRVERSRGPGWVLAADPATGEMFLGRGGQPAATGIRPATAATLPRLEKNWDLRPRLFVDVTDDANRKLGRPVFLDFVTDLGDIGVPADARTVITVGAADLENRMEKYSAAGPPANLELMRKPNVFAYDALQFGPEASGGAFGSSVSASFAAGLAACVLSSGASPEQIIKHIQTESGGVLRVPLTK